MDMISGALGKAVTEAGKAAVSAAGETLGGGVANAATDTKWISGLFGKLSLALQDNFHAYLRNAEKNYNEVRTLATEPELRTMTGEKGIYVKVGVSLSEGRTEREIPASKVESLLKVGNAEGDKLTRNVQVRCKSKTAETPTGSGFDDAF